MSKLLFAEHPLVVNPVLAARVGINEAIVLQQIHYWVEINRQKDWNFYEDRYWTYETQEDWLKQFPWLKLRSLQRIIANLKSLDLILIRQFDAKDWKQRNYYTIDYNALENLPEQPSNPVKSDAAKLAASNTTDWRHQERQIGGMIYTETSSENSSEIHSKTSLVKRTSALLAKKEDASLEDPNLNSQKDDRPPQTASLSNQAKAIDISRDLGQDKEVPPILPRADNPEFGMPLDKDGWVQLPRAKRFTLARFLTVRRMQAVLAFSVVDQGVEPAYGKNRDSVQMRGNQVGIHALKDDKWQWETDAFDKGGALSLKALRNYGCKHCGVSQEWFNQSIARLLDASIDWCKRHRDDATEILEKNSVVCLFLIGDLKRLRLHFYEPLPSPPSAEFL